MKKILLSTLLTLTTAAMMAQTNSFPVTGNASLGMFNYLSVGRVYIQYPASLAANWPRGILSQNVNWDNTNLAWNVPFVGSTSDFSLIRFENGGHIGFFTRSSTGNAYTLTNTAMESYRRMIILTNGNVGIGTTTPFEKLAVNGNIRAKEIKVETANWPDYVFADAYKLPDLKEIEAFIRKNGHLPGIPTAAEVAKEGISLGEMNRKLLEKVEELTLYLLEKERNEQRQDERIRAQDERILNLELKLQKHGTN